MGEFLLEQEQQCREEGDQEISIIIRSRENPLSSGSAFVSGQIIDRRFDSEYEIVEGSIADMEEDIRPDEFESLSDKSPDKCRNQ